MSSDPSSCRAVIKIGYSLAAAESYLIYGRRTSRRPRNFGGDDSATGDLGF